MAVLATAMLMGVLQPVGPDASVYLLHTRTLLEEGNRYVSSHDNKGPMMVWLTAPAARIFGANALAGGVIRAGSALAVAGILFFLLRRQGRYPRPAAISLACLSASLPYSSVLWGDSIRPETYAVTLNGLILLLAWRGTWPAALLGGAATAVIVFMKSILALPAMTMLAGWLVMDGIRTRTWPVRPALAMLAGGLLVASASVAWLARHDSLAQWYRQTLEWPAEYRSTIPPTEIRADAPVLSRLLAVYKASDDPGRPWLMPIKIPVTVLRSGLWPLFLLAVILAVRGGIDRSRVNLLALLWLGGVLLELGLEHRRWPYPAAGLIPPLLLWIALAPAGGRSPRPATRTAWAWACSILVLAGLGGDAIRLFGDRLADRPASPYEALTGQIRPHYRTGERLLVLDNNYDLHLNLPAPRPPQILPMHAAMVNAEEREKLRREVEQHPPDWIAAKDPSYTGFRFGGVEEGPVRVEERDGELFIIGPYHEAWSADGAWARRLSKP